MWIVEREGPQRTETLGTRERRKEMKRQGLCTIILVCASFLAVSTPAVAETRDRTKTGVAWQWTELPGVIAEWWVGLVQGGGLEVASSAAMEPVKDSGPPLMDQVGETSGSATTELSPAIDPNG